MRKELLSMLFLLAVCYQSVRSQTPIPYYDAIALKAQYVDSVGKVRLTPEMKQLLARYYTGVAAGDITLDKLDQNPFFKDMFKAVGQQDQGTRFVGTTAGNALAALGGTDVTQVVDGLAKFLVERAKEELSITFFEKFKEDLGKPQFKDLKLLLPQTYATLMLIDTRIYQYSAYLTELRDAFTADLKELGYNIPVALQQGSLANYFKQHAELKTVLSLAAQLTTTYLSYNSLPHPGTVIEGLDPDHYFGSGSSSDMLMNGSIKLLQLVSNSFRSGNADRYWVPGDSLVDFAGDKVKLKLYLGLLYNGASGIKLQTDTTVVTLLNDMAAHYNDRIGPFSDGIKVFAGLVGGIDDYLKYKQGQTNRDTSALFYYRLYTQSIDAISSGLGLVKVIDPSFHPAFVKFLPAIKTLGDIYINSEQHKFSLAVLSVVKLFDDLKGAGVDSKFLARLSTYASFAAEVAQAKSSDEVKDIIAQTVLPVGSASIKKNSRFNIALNAYLGGFFGREHIPDNGVKPWASSWGVTAPIGVAFSWPIRIQHCTWGSFSLYGNLFDLGAVASFRLKDSTTATLPKLTLQNIFAPGLGAIWGLPKVPLSIGYMYQWGPQLREITSTTADLGTGSLNSRWYIFVAVDIPLLNIFNKPR